MFHVLLLLASAVPPQRPAVEEPWPADWAVHGPVCILDGVGGATGRPGPGGQAAVAAAAAVASRDLLRSRFRWQDDPTNPSWGTYPYDGRGEFAGVEAVPLVVLPDPATLDSRFAPGEAAARPGKALLFIPGEVTGPVTLPVPAPANARRPPKMSRIGSYDPGAGRQLDFDDPPGLTDEVWWRSLRVGEPGGAVPVASINTTRMAPDNPRVLQVVVEPADGADPAVTGPPRSFFAFAMVPGVGLDRGGDAAAGLHRFDKPLDSPAHHPRIGVHSLLRLPNPSPNRGSSEAGQRRREAWNDEVAPYVHALHPLTPEQEARKTELIKQIDSPLGEQSVGRAYEVLAMDEWFGRQEQKLWALRVGEGSRPLRESFVLVPADAPSNRPLHSLYLFTGWDTDRVARELRKVQIPPNQLDWFLDVEKDESPEDE